MKRADRNNPIFCLLLPPVFWLGVWQLCALLVDRSMVGRGNELLLPYPATVLAALTHLAGTGEFWESVLLSLLRVLAGLVVGAAPVASFILLVLLWTGRDQVPVVIVALMVLPVVWDSLSQGIRATDAQWLELARAYRFSRWKTVRLIYLPGLRPHLSAALTTATGLAWKSGVAAEVLCLPSTALGTEIYQTKYYLEIPELFAWTGVAVALSLLLEHLLRRALARWGRRWSL